MVSLVKPTLQELRQLVGAIDRTEKEKSAFSLYPAGLPHGSLIDMSGNGKTEFVARFLSEHSDYMTAWIEERISINPYALKQKKVRLEKLLFIEAEKEMVWCTTQALQSGCFKVIVSNEQTENEKVLRRYQLLAEKCQSLFFLLSEEVRPSWIPQLQLKVSRMDAGLEIQKLKGRGLG